MDLNCFRDKLFDLLNDSEEMGITDLNADEQNSMIAVRTESGKVFEIVCREATDREYRWKLLQGKWLEWSGFSAGDKITVDCQRGRLVITKDEPEADIGTR